MSRNRHLHHLLREIARDPAGEHSLESLASRVRRSPFHLQRAFRELALETPKQYTLRLRLEHAAARLAACDDSVLEIALEAGFHSHEVFARAFRRRFGCSPSRYRRVALAGASAAERARHAEVVDAAGPCVNLFRVPLERWHGSTRDRLGGAALADFPIRSSSARVPRPNHLPMRRAIPMPTSPIGRRDLAAVPILFIRREASRAELPATIGECLGSIFTHAQKAGLVVAGHPLSRYPSAGQGLVTIDVALPLAAPGAGDGEIRAGFLAEGPAAVATHEGPYDTLGETYAALERWMSTERVAARGAPWEVYVTDPADYPNPADWRTEVFWPIE